MTLSPEAADARQRVTGYFEERFGVPASAFDGHLLLRSGQSYWALSESAHAEALLGFPRLEYLGVRVLRRVGRFLKPTTYALQRFARDARKNVVRIDRETLGRLLGSETGVEGDYDAEPGYVVLRMGDDVLGCGLWLGGRLRHCFPKGRGTALRAGGLY